MLEYIVTYLLESFMLYALCNTLYSKLQMYSTHNIIFYNPILLYRVSVLTYRASVLFYCALILAYHWLILTGL